jgi:sugar-specific transcriptional regulator TrmB
MQIIDILKNFGLSANESKIYLSSLETGLSSAQNIADKAKLKRTTTYSVLETLVGRGLIIKTQEEGHNRFMALEPDNLITVFENYQTDLKKALPELKAINNIGGTKPRVMFFEGQAGIKNIYYDTIEEKPEIILQWNTTDIAKVLPDFPEEYLRFRSSRQIKAKRIAPDDKLWQEHAQLDKEELSQTKLLSVDKYNNKVEINIYNNKVAFMSYGDEMGLIIESKVVADTMRNIYNLFWEKI